MNKWKLFYSDMTEKFYISKTYKCLGKGKFQIIGKKYDFTEEIESLLIDYKLEIANLKAKIKDKQRSK